MYVICVMRVSYDIHVISLSSTHLKPNVYNTVFRRMALWGQILFLLTSFKMICVLCVFCMFYTLWALPLSSSKVFAGCYTCYANYECYTRCEVWTPFITIIIVLSVVCALHVWNDIHVMRPIPFILKIMSCKRLASN